MSSKAGAGPRDGVGYRADSAVSARDAGAAEPQVVFYQLTRKFVDCENSIPEESQDVMYYTLAVGHHTGVIDCFEERLRLQLADFERAVALLGPGDARYKLEGIMRHGEIQIDATHVGYLYPAVKGLLDGGAGESGAAGEQAAGRGSGIAPEDAAWLAAFAGMLETLMRDHAAYIMGRVRRL